MSELTFDKKKQRCIHLCLQTGRDFGFTRRSARLPRELWFLAVRYCRRRRITHGLGSLMWTQWGLLSSMFARKGRQCFKHSFQCHGVPVPEFTRVSGRAPIARGLTRFWRPPVLCDGSKRQTTALEFRGIPTRRVRPVIRPLFFHFTTVICL